MASVPWYFNAIILDNVLLNDSVSVSTVQFGLSECLLIEITLRDEAIIAWDVSCHFSGSH